VGRFGPGDGAGTRVEHQVAALDGDDAHTSTAAMAILPLPPD